MNFAENSSRSKSVSVPDLNNYDELENNMNQWGVILQAGIEGGCITLYGQYSGKNWICRKDALDQTPKLIDELASRSRSEQVHSWEDALQVLDRHPWHLFCPLEVCPVFKGAVLAAVFTQNRPDMIADDLGFRQWLQICSDLPHVEWKLAL